MPTKLPFSGGQKMFHPTEMILIASRTTQNTQGSTLMVSYSVLCLWMGHFRAGWSKCVCHSVDWHWSPPYGVHGQRGYFPNLPFRRPLYSLSLVKPNGDSTTHEKPCVPLCLINAPCRCYYSRSSPSGSLITGNGVNMRLSWSNTE